MTPVRARSTTRLARALPPRPFGPGPIPGRTIAPPVPSPPEPNRFADLRLPEGRVLPLASAALRGPLVMGILNITPDSFSDGGRYSDPQRAIERGLEMLEEGADLLDLGAESTRPAGTAYGQGAETVSADEEITRLLPVLTGLRAFTKQPLSIDTRKAAVARAALDASADLINDVSALEDPEMASVVAEARVPLVLMHLRGSLPEIQQHARYDDVVREVRDELAAALQRAVAGGVAESRVLLDPGLGFAKGDRHNLTLLRRLDALWPLGRPLLVGASRKRFIGKITGVEAERRAAGSLAAVAWAIRHRAAIVRVHDVRETRHFIDVYREIDDADSPGSEATRRARP